MLSGAKGQNLHYATLKTRLESLRSAFPAGIKAEVYCTLFDEFLANREFGLALEVLCDFLLQPDVQPVGEAELNEIAQLHVLMEVQDQCFQRLRQKRGDLGNKHERE